MTRMHLIRRGTAKVLMAGRIIAALTLWTQRLRRLLVSVDAAIPLHLRILLVTIASIRILPAIVNDHTFTMLLHIPTSEVVVGVPHKAIGMHVGRLGHSEVLIHLWLRGWCTEVTAVVACIQGCRERIHFGIEIILP